MDVSNDKAVSYLRQLQTKALLIIIGVLLPVALAGAVVGIAQGHLVKAFRSDTPLSSEPAALDADPSLTIPEDIPAGPNSEVAVPITLASNGNSVSSLTFSIDFDEANLSFDDTDANLDGIPDDIAFSVPGAFAASGSYSALDTDGEIDIVIFDPVPPLATLPDGLIVEITFTTGSPPSGTDIPVIFSSAPSPSGGTPSGGSLVVVGDGGSILIGAPLAVQLDYFIATAQDDAVRLEWATISELKNVGFNLYRETAPGEPQEKLNDDLIPAQGSNLSGATYDWLDRLGSSQSVYFLESIDVAGHGEMHGPALVTVPDVSGSERMYLPWLASEGNMPSR